MHEDAYYYGLRTVARARTMEALNRRILKDGGTSTWHGTRLASIDTKAIEYAERTWPSHYSRATHSGFTKPWSSIWYHAQLQPANFNLAIWQEVNGENVLQGLAVGGPSSGRQHLTLNWVERNFGPEYTRFGVLIPVLMCFEEYASLLGCERVLIKNPVDPNKYKRYGYERFELPKSTTVFLSKEMPNG